MSETIYPSASHGFIPTSGVLVSFPSADPTQLVVKDDNHMGDLIPWGDNNNFPQKILERARKSTIIPTALKWQANMISKQVLPFDVDYDDDGNRKLTYVRDQDIHEFLNNRHFKRYQRESANDIFWFLNIFPELILSKDRKKITHIHPNEAAYCRISKQNARGVSEHCYLSANWPDATDNSPETKKIKMLDPYQYDLAEWTRERKEYKFIYPSSYPTPGCSFYQLAHWDGIRTSGWLSVLESVPSMKKWLFENSMNIKYHLQVPSSYWEHKYGSAWKKATPDEQMNMKRETIDLIETQMTGTKKSGISLVTEFGISAIDGTTREEWKLEAIPDKTKDGAHLADNMEATAHLLYALGLDPVLFGFASKEMGSRSGGSDKRESLLIYLSNLDPYQDVMFEPLEFIAEYNGWKKKHPRLKFLSERTLLTTLDTGSQTKTLAN